MKKFYEVSHKKVLSPSQIIVIFCSLFVIVCMIVYQFTPATNSDNVEGVIWANETLQSGKLLSSEFLYPYAIPFGANLFMLPFVSMFGVSQLANSLGMLLFFLLLLATIVYFVRSITKDIVATFLGIAVILLAYRSEVGRNQFHHILFYQLGFICFLGISASLIRLVFDGFSFRSILLLICFAVWGGANGISAMALANIPLLAGLCIFMIWRRSTITSKKIIKCILILLFSTVVGYLFYILSMRNVHEFSYIDAVGSFTFKNIDAWVDNLRHLLADWLKLFINSPEGKIITEFSGIDVLFSLLLAIIAGILPIYYLVKIKHLSEKEYFLCFSCMLVWTVCLMQYILLRGAQDRLLFNGVLVNFVLFSVFLIQKHIKLPQRDTVFYEIGLSIFAVCLTASFVIFTPFKSETTLTDQLYEKNLRYGFGTFWNANYHTVNSNNRVKIRPIQLDNGKIEPLSYQSSVSWYSQDQITEDEKWFLLVTEFEWKELMNSINKAATELCEDEFQIESYHILVYKKQKWDDLLDTHYFSYNFSNSSWQKGCETDSGKRLINDGGISFGPYISIPSGRNIHITIRGNNLDYSSVQAYEVGNEGIIPLDNMEVTNDLIEIDLISPELSAFEIAITNPDNDDFMQPIVLTSEEIIIK